MSTEVSPRNFQRTQANISPNHPYYKAIVNKQQQQQQQQRPRSISLRTMQRDLSQQIESDGKFTVESIDSGDSTDSFLPREETYSLTQHPKTPPNRVFRLDSNYSIESDIFHEESHFASTPLGCSETPDWSIDSSGYAMGSPSLRCSVSSSLPPSPLSILKSTFLEMAALPRISSLSRLSNRSDIIPRPQFKNEQDFRLAGYQLKESPIIEEKSVKSQFRFSLSSCSHSNSNK